MSTAVQTTEAARTRMLVGGLKFILLFLVVITLARLWTMHPIEDFGDNVHRWYPILHWSHGSFPGFAPNHHVLRWAINIPATIVVVLGGGTALGYYVLSVAPFVIGLYLIYGLTHQLASPLIAFLLLLWFLVNPSLAGMNSQLMPETYTFMYVALLLVLLFKYVTTDKKRYFALALLAALLCYGAKETSAFIMPGWFAWELLRRRFRHASLLVLGFCIGLLIETVVVSALFGLPLYVGRVGLLAGGGHVEAMLADTTHSVSDLLGRWLPFEHPTDVLSKVTYWAFFAAAAWFTFRCRGLLFQRQVNAEADQTGAFIHLTNALGLSFAFLTTFFVISLDPFRLGQPLEDRYLWILLPMAGVSLAYTFEREIRPRLDSWLPTWPWGQARPSLAYAVLIVGAALIGAGADMFYSRTIADRANGGRPAYSVFTANAYYRDRVARPFLDGCEMLFVDRRAAWTALAFGLPWDSITPPVVFYRRELEQVRVGPSGDRIVATEVPVAEFPEIASHPSIIDGQVMRIRLDVNPNRCSRPLTFLGHGYLQIEVNPPSR